jgi:hypothetical protein
MIYFIQFSSFLRLHCSALCCTWFQMYHMCGYKHVTRTKKQISKAANILDTFHKLSYVCNFAGHGMNMSIEQLWWRHKTMIVYACSYTHWCRRRQFPVTGQVLLLCTAPLHDTMPRVRTTHPPTHSKVCRWLDWGDDNKDIYWNVIKDRQKRRR